MSLQAQCYVAVAICASFCLTLISANRAPEWKGLDSDPKLGNYMKNQLENTELKLSCPSKGRPRPDTIWYKNNEAFMTSSDRVRVKGTNLKFTFLMVEDEANYTCVAQNTEGQIEFTYVLKVKEKIWPLEVNVSSNLTIYEGDKATFYCRVLNDKSAEIQWLRIGQDDANARPSHSFLESGEENPETLVIHDVTKADEGQYTCLIGNEFGSKYQHMYLIVTEMTTTTTSTTTTTTTPTTTSTTSTTSTTTTPTTTLPAPGIPTNVQVVRTSHNTMRVTWDEPRNYMWVKLYRVYYTDNYNNGYEESVDIMAPNTRAVIDYVDPYVTYEVKVQAQSIDESWGEQSVTVLIGQYSTPAPPTTQPPTTMKPKKKKKDKNKKKNKNKKDKKNKNKKKKDKERKNDRDRNSQYDLDTIYGDMSTDTPFNEDSYLFPYGDPNFNKNSPYDDDYNTNTNMFEPKNTNDHGPYNGDPNDNMSEIYEDGNSEANNGTAKEAAAVEGEIGVWTLYIIVGAVAGGVLLAGLVAIAIALCCQREEESQYKSTSV